MKTLNPKSYPSLAFAMIALLSVNLAFIGISGCTTSAQRVTYNTLYSTHVAVDSAFSGYMSSVIIGTTPTNNVPKAAQAYREFQSVFNTAIAVAQFNTNAPASGVVLESATKVFTATGKATP